VKNQHPFRAGLALAVLLSALNSQFSAAFAQGSLTPPPGPPSPTMITLSQIEPRTPISSVAYAITQPGSYYLTTNIIDVSNQNGININANNVTLDLKGFSLLGFSGPGGNNIGINIGPYTNVIVRNGIISGWGFAGIQCTANNVILEHLILSADNTGMLWNGNDDVIRYCMVSGNSQGISLSGSGSLVVDNELAGNSVGIFVNAGNSQIEGNHVTGNGGYGIQILSESYVTNNILIRNTVRGSGANNYSFNSSQIIGPLITNTVSGIITNSNPWANFSF
jgi:parallel beta-helix repeat protein